MELMGTVTPITTGTVIHTTTIITAMTMTVIITENSASKAMVICLIIIPITMMRAGGQFLPAEKVERITFDGRHLEVRGPYTQMEYLIPLISGQGVIILKLRNWEVIKMAQRRSEKPRKMKLSPKQEEFYRRIGSLRR